MRYSVPGKLAQLSCERWQLAEVVHADSKIGSRTNIHIVARDALNKLSPPIRTYGVFPHKLFRASGWRLGTRLAGRPGLAFEEMQWI